MDNYDSNMIKPVDSLQTITGLTGTRRREQRKRRQKFDSEKQEQEQKMESEENKKKFDETLYIDDADDSKIDYRA